MRKNGWLHVITTMSYTLDECEVQKKLHRYGFDEARVIIKD